MLKILLQYLKFLKDFNNSFRHHKKAWFVNIETRKKGYTLYNMKNILLITAFLLSFAAFAQDNKPLGNFYLENGVVYHHVFIDSIDSANVIVQKLMAALPSTPNIKNVVDNGVVITADYDEVKSNLGGSGETTGNITIEIKNGKYRVTIINIVAKTPALTLTFEQEFTKNKNTEWNGTAKKYLPGNDSFTNMFVLKKPSKKDW